MTTDRFNRKLSDLLTNNLLFGLLVVVKDCDMEFILDFISNKLDPEDI